MKRLTSQQRAIAPGELDTDDTAPFSAGILSFVRIWRLQALIPASEVRPFEFRTISSTRRMMFDFPLDDPKARSLIDQARIRAAVRALHDADMTAIVADFSGELPLGLVVHKGERDATVRMLLHRSTGERIRQAGMLGVRFDKQGRGEADMLLQTLRTRLYRIARKPISQRHTERHLAISSIERNRWTKDGRLKHYGSAQMKKGVTLVTLATYAPDIVEALQARPDIIETWRGA